MHFVGPPQFSFLFFSTPDLSAQFFKKTIVQLNFWNSPCREQLPPSCIHVIIMIIVIIIIWYIIQKLFLKYQELFLMSRGVQYVPPLRQELWRLGFPFNSIDLKGDRKQTWVVTEYIYLIYPLGTYYALKALSWKGGTPVFIVFQTSANHFIVVLYLICKSYCYAENKKLFKITLKIFNTVAFFVYNRMYKAWRKELGSRSLNLLYASYNSILPKFSSRERLLLFTMGSSYMLI